MHPINLENCGILFCHFPGLESPGKRLQEWKVLEIFSNQAIKFQGFTKNVFRWQGELIYECWE